MPKGIKNKAAKKRPYKRKEKLVPILNKDTPKDNEVDLLMAIIIIFENWDNEQRSRALKYLASRYYDFM